MDLINKILSSVFNILFLPFKNVDPVWAMLAISAVAGVVMLLVFKATSDQAGIKRAKNLVKGHFLAIRLYKDDIGLMLDTMKNIISSNLLYMKQSLRPMLFLMVPVGIVLIQLGIRYEFRPLRTGERVVVTLGVADDSVELSEVELILPAGLVAEMPPVRIEQVREVNWRIRAEKAGVFTLSFKYGDKVVEKRLQIVDSLVPITAQIASHDLGITLMNPAEASLPSGSFASVVSILYPKREAEFWGITMHWLVAFFVFSLIVAFGLKGTLGVEV